MTLRHARPLLLGGSVVLALALAACTSTPDPAPTSAAPTASSSATASAAPVLVPDGTAQDNLPYFRSIVDTVWEGPDQVQGRAYIDALVAGGFDKTKMQVTSDESTVGNPAESIQFSVLWTDGQCLIGQVGPATGGALAVVQPAVLGGTGCLLGNTRPIDW